MFGSFEDEFMYPEVRATVEASFCGIGCESEGICPHAPAYDWQQEESDWNEANEMFADWHSERFGRI